MTDTPLTELLDPDTGSDGTSVVDEPDDFADDFDDAAPGRRVPRLTMLLLAAVLVAVGFTGGVLLQKHAVAGTTATGVPSFGAGFPSGGFPGAGGGQPPGSGTGTGTGTGSTSGSASSAGSPVVIGTVARVDGTTVIVKDFGGKEHKVTTTSDTTITRSAPVPASELKAGQSVRVDGSKKSDGAIVATSVTAR